MLDNWRKSGRSVLTAGVVPVAALILLAGSLPRDAEPGGDLWPADAQTEGMVDERGQLGLRLLVGGSDALYAL